MKNVLIIGAGRFGRYTAKKLHDLGHQIMMIDQDEEKINEALPFVTSAEIGDSTNKDFLQSIGINDYDLCIVAIGDNFLSSLETTFQLYELGAKQIISRVSSESQEKFLLRNGANAVVFPERELGNWTAIRYSSDLISNYIQLFDGYSIFEVPVPEQWANKKVGDLDIRKRYGFNILGIKSNQLNMDINVDTVMNLGETIVVLGKTEQIQKVFSL